MAKLEIKFHDYLKNLKVKDVRRGLIDLFKTLDTKVEDRDPYMDEELASFPYVNVVVLLAKSLLKTIGLLSRTLFNQYSFSRHDN